MAKNTSDDNRSQERKNQFCNNNQFEHSRK